MSRIVVTVALLLISGLVTEAAANEGLKKSQEKAKKVQAYLQSIGINDPAILEFTSTIGQRMEGRYVRIAEERYESGRLVLHYSAKPKMSIRQLELKFQPTDLPHSEIVATTRSLMWNHKYQF